MKIPEAVQDLKQRWRRFFGTSPKPAGCIFCPGSVVWWNGARMRSASVLLDGVVVYIADVLCRRVKCGNPECGRSWTLRPAGLTPQRHFQLCVVAKGTSRYLFDEKTSLSQVARECSCHRHTVGRWLGWEAGIARPADLQRHIAEASDVPVTVKIPPVAGLARKAVNAASRTMLKTAAQVLCLMEALGAAVGLEPPGLRSVVEAVLANRYRVTTYASPSIPDFGRRGRLFVGALWRCD